MAVPVVCEYIVANEIMNMAQNSQIAEDPYVNVFILPKKYHSIADVRLRDVINAFPLTSFDKSQKYLLRFEQVLQLSASKQMKVWLDLGKNQDICVPNSDGKIKIKALRLPKGVQLKIPAGKQAAASDSPSTRSKMRHSDVSFLKKPTVGQSSDSLFEAKRESSKSGYQQQMPQTALKSKGRVQTSNDLLGQQYNNDIQVNQPAPASFDNPFETPQPTPQAQQQPQPEQNPYAKVNSSVENPYVQAFNDSNLFGNNTSEQANMSSSNDAGVNESGWDANPFAGGESFFGEQPTTTHEPPQTQHSFAGTQPETVNFFDAPVDSHNNTSGAQTATNHNNILSGLSDLNFGGVQEEPPIGESTNGETAPVKEKTRTEQLHQMYADEGVKKQGAERASDLHEDRLNHWMGKPVKNHLRVLICTLPDILWQGHGFQRVGMDKLQDPNEVRKAYRKYMVKFHPDKFEAEGDPEKIYISNFVFAAISEQWAIFKKETGIQ